MPDLYMVPGACSLASHIVARELGHDPTLIRVDLATKRLADGSDYLAVNGKGQVPALRLDSGELLTEGPVILQYLADGDPQGRLLAPVGSPERYRTLAWLNFEGPELHKSFSPLMRPTTPPDYRPVAIAQIEAKMALVDSHLTGRDYLGPAFSIADAYLFVICTWLPRAGIDVARWPALAAFVARVSARAPVARAISAEQAV